MAEPKIEWVNGGEPVDGKYSATIDMMDGSGVQKFEGANHKEIADKLMVAQANATKKIRELSKTVEPEAGRTVKERKPRALSADESVAVARDLTDPAKAAGAITTVVEAALGGPLKEVADKLNDEEFEALRQEALKACADFIAETPDYLVNDFNEKAMFAYGELHNIAITKNNLKMIWDRLKEAGTGLVQVKTETPATEEGGAPRGLPETTTRQRGTVSSTGTRRGDSSGQPVESGRKGKLTRQEIEAMPANEYKTRLNGEPGFREAVDAAFSGS